jgi:hypothetical protein
MKQESWRDSCPLLDGERKRGSVSYDLHVQLPESPEETLEQVRGMVRSDDSDASTALFELYNRDAPMTLAFTDGRRLDFVLESYDIRQGGMCDGWVLGKGPAYIPSDGGR